jgi:hypothetical protein
LNLAGEERFLKAQESETSSVCQIDARHRLMYEVHHGSPHGFRFRPKGIMSQGICTNRQTRI